MIRLEERASARALLSFSWIVVLSSCATDPTRLRVPAPDAAQFEQDVYPVLLRDCGFPACHGNPRRFFRVFGPGRSRLEPGTGLFSVPTEAELMQSYDRARSMLANVGEPDDALLLRKPLARSAGGQGHEGSNEYGENVYASTEDAGYQTLLNWAFSTRQGAAENEP